MIKSLPIVRKISLFIFIVVSSLIIFSCSKDDSKETEAPEITISVEDFTKTVNEHPEDNYILGKVIAETNRGNLTFVIEEQNPNDAFFIDQSTGELSVKDGSLFDFQTNPELTALVKVSNESVFENASVTIIINEPEAPDYHRMIDKDNIWVDESTIQDGMSDTFIQRKIYLDGEEIINGKNYFSLFGKIIDYKFGTLGWSRHDNSVGEERFLYKIRENEETKKVYALDENNNEVLLYDFSLQENDVVDLWDPTTKNYITQTVTEIEDITLLNGELRKKITFASRTSIIEGVGYNQVYVSRAASLIGFFNENTLLLKSQYSDFEEDFWDHGNLPDISLEDFCIVNNEIISRSNLIGDGGNYVENNILEKGICWSTSTNPTVEDNFTSEYTNEYSYSSEVSDLKKFFTSVFNTTLQPNTGYYFKSYSKSLNGVSYSDNTHSINSGFLSSSLFTSLLSKEYFEGTYTVRLKGGITANNFPNGVNVVEKGFARVIWDDNNKPIHGPFGSVFYAVEEGSLENFELTTNFSKAQDYGNRTVHFWSYIKFDNGVVVYGKQLLVSGN
jgi:hypothetical protein